MSRDSASGMLLPFVVGVGVGAAVALLLTPKTGEELRGEIATSVSDGLDQARRAGEGLQRKAEQFVDLAQDRIENAMEAGERAYRDAKNT